jgi:hypothetical protein
MYDALGGKGDCDDPLALVALTCRVATDRMSNDRGIQRFCRRMSWRLNSLAIDVRIPGRFDTCQPTCV